jgi:ribosomal protein S18 acetylase RimI-like enzyme
LKDGTIFVNAGEIDCYALVNFKFGILYIWAIATDPTARGQGFANQVLDEIARHALAIRESRIGLATNVNNPAQKLYFDKGYRVTKHLRDFYGRGDHGLFMERNMETL